MANDELYTPKWIFDSLKLIFDLDVCAPKGGPVHTPAVEYFDQESDGLASKWFGLVYMNPPYSQPRPWVEKWLAHGSGIALVPFAKSQWFVDLWNSDAVGVPLPTKTKFLSPELKDTNIWMPTGLWAIGPVAERALERSEIARVR